MAKIVRIISGGQTGADRGGLDAAIYAGIAHGGWCPKGRKAEDGPIPAIYGLKETKSANYKIRTEWNVRDADATIIFTDGELEGGSLATARFCEKHGKPWLHVDLLKEETRHPGLIASYRQPHIVRRMRDWLTGSGDFDGRTPKPPEECVLNIAGQRESKAQMLQHRVKILVVDLLIETGSASRAYGINDEG